MSIISPCPPPTFSLLFDPSSSSPLLQVPLLGPQAPPSALSRLWGLRTVAIDENRPTGGRGLAPSPHLRSSSIYRSSGQLLAELGDYYRRLNYSSPVEWVRDTSTITWIPNEIRSGSTGLQFSFRFSVVVFGIVCKFSTDGCHGYLLTISFCSFGKLLRLAFSLISHEKAKQSKANWIKANPKESQPVQMMNYSWISHFQHLILLLATFIYLFIPIVINLYFF